MSIARVWLVLIAVCLIALTVGLGSQLAEGAQARSPTGETGALGITIPYAGRLASAEGQPVADGPYDFSFALYEAEMGGEPLWSEIQQAIAVTDGAFRTALGSIHPVSHSVLDGCTRWLAVGIRRSGEDRFVPLSPRQEVTASTSGPASASTVGAPCPHDHWGETWQGNGPGMILRSSDGPGLAGYSVGSDGVHGEAAAANKSGVFGVNHGSGFGVFGRGSAGPGVAGWSAKGDGVSGETGMAGKSGVFGLNSGSGFGVFGRSNSGTGVGAWSATGAGMHGETGAVDGIGVVGTNTKNGNYGELGTPGEGVHAVAFSQGGAGLFAQSAKGPAVHAEGDLVVTGAYRGNIGPGGGAAFPRPAYDSGWKAISKGGTLVLTHGIGGNRDNYVVDMQFKDTSGKVHNYLYGAMTWSEYLGAWWTDLTNQQITVERMKDDEWVLQVRVRIWVYR
jgi:hypothetical protein